MPPRPLPAPPAPTATVGRDRELLRVAAALADPAGAGVVVTGAAGHGRSRLADDAAAAARAAGRAVTWVRLSRPGTPVDELPALRALRAAPDPAGTDSGPDRRPLVCVDDAHLLDDAAAAALHELAATGVATLLLTLRADRLPSTSLVALWKDGLCDRLDLGPLTRAAADELVRALLRAPADSGTSARLWRLTRGVPRHLVEIVGGGIRAGALHEVAGVCVWRGPLTVPPRLVELVEAELAGTADTAGTADDAARAALELVAAGAPAGAELLARAGADPQVLERLERAGVLAATRSGRRLLLDVADPVVAQVVRQRTGSLRARGINRRLASAWAAAGGRRVDDALREATARLAGGQQPAGEPALAAARQAHRRFDLTLAEVLARGALESGAGPAAAGALARSLALQGRAHEAEATLRAARPPVGTGIDTGPTAAPPDPEPAADVRGELLDVRVTNLRWGLGHEHAAKRMLARDGHAGMHALRARLLLWDGAFEAAQREARAALTARPAPPGRRESRGSSLEPRLEALAVAVAAGCALGRTGEAVGLVPLDLVAPPAEAPGPHGRPAPAAVAADPPGGVALEELASWLCQAHVMHGSLDDAERIAVAGHDRANRSGLLILAAWWAVRRGSVAMARGRCRTAEALFREAVAQVRTAEAPSLHRGLILGSALRWLAHASVLLGDTDTASRALGEAVRFPPTGFDAVHLWWPDAATHLAAGRSQTARAVELATAHAARSRDACAPALELRALHDLVALGRAPQILGRVRVLAGQVDGPLPRLLADHVEAAAAGSATGLEAVAARFLELGADLTAAEAATQAARAHAAAGRDSSARRATAIATSALARCEGAGTPVTALLREPPGLTQRQREIAALAGQGMRSKAIARRLVLSVRTVDNCLGQVYRKLGISSRSELAAALGIPVRVTADLGVAGPGDARSATG
jgi:DNA-binding CsgD family transcriptional regulator